MLLQPWLVQSTAERKTEVLYDDSLAEMLSCCLSFPQRAV